MDKAFIINEIKKLLGYKNDTDFANFLGVKQPTISTWRKRNSIDYDLIISKCKIIDANWLLTGKGEMLKRDLSDKEREEYVENKLRYPNNDNLQIKSLSNEEKMDLIISQNEDLKNKNKSIEDKINRLEESVVGNPIGSKSFSLSDIYGLLEDIRTAQKNQYDLYNLQFDEKNARRTRKLNKKK